MPNREKVIKGLEVCLKNIDQQDCPNDCPYLSDCSEYENRVIFQPLMRDALEMLKEQETCWILCSDRLPKSNPEDLEYPAVIIALKDGTVELGCYYESTKEWGAGENFDRPRQPVAWMPLPELYADRR